MDLQTTLVALIVPACTAYALWHLMPASWRRRLRGRAAADAGGCQCDACPGAARAPGSTAVTWHGRRPGAGSSSGRR